MPIGSFSGSDFRLQSVTPVGLATLRARFTQDPKVVDAAASNDALNPLNYTLTGPAFNYVTSAGSVIGDPQSVDLYLAAPLEIGAWTLEVNAGVIFESGDPIEPPLSLTFTVTQAAQQEALSKGGVNDAVENVLRKHLSPALKGPNWDSVIAALAAGDAPNWNNAALAANQLHVSTASGKYLEARASDHGYRKPTGLAMPDDLFRNLVTVSRAAKLTQEAILDVLEVFYGPDAVRATSTTTLEEPFALADGDDLKLLIDERESVDVIFDRNEFGRIGEANAVEVAAAITRTLRRARSQAYAVAVTNELTNEQQVRIYSGRKGLSSSVRVVGGKAQTRLLFPTPLFVTSGGSPFATWKIEASSTNPGNLRYTELSGIYDLNEVVAGDMALIYGLEFSPTDNTGTFEIQEVSVSYSGITLIQYFEITNPDGQAVLSLPQLTFQGLMFHRPTRRTFHHQQRRVVVSQSGPAADIEVPATTEAVTRTAKTGSYAVTNTPLDIVSLERSVAGTVTVTFGAAHDMVVGEQILIDNVLPSSTIPATTPGTPSGIYGTP